jgi:hypothetical protein
MPFGSNERLQHHTKVLQQEETGIVTNEVALTTGTYEVASVKVSAQRPTQDMAKQTPS